VTGNKYTLLFLLSCSILAGSEANVNHHYSKGKEAYRNGQFELAIQEFESILENNWVSPQLYYNLGNAYFREGKTGGAVWAYESALQIAPGHDNARYNLKLSNLKVKDRVELPEPPFYLSWYLLLLERFTSTEWINISAGFLFLFALCFLFNSLSPKKYIHLLKSTFMIAFIIGSLFSSHSLQKSKEANLGIIYEPQVEVRSEPNTFSTRLFEVHEGLKVSVNNRQNSWIEIELVDGKTGWIEAVQIRTL